MQLCDACGEGRLHPVTSKEAAEYKGNHGQFVVHYSVCEVCKAEIVDAADSLKNKREWVRFKKVVDHIPLGAEIAEMRKRYHLSQSQAANIFGGGPVAFSKYENDDLIPDESMVNLLKLAITYPDTIKRLAKIKGIELLEKNEFSSNEYLVVIGRKFTELSYSMPSTPEKRVHKRVSGAKKNAPSQPLIRSSKIRIENIPNGNKSWVLH